MTITSAANSVTSSQAPEFVPHPFLKDGHAMTIAPVFWPRTIPESFLQAAVVRNFQVDENSQVITLCHWQPQPQEHATMLVLHGLEGSADSPHVRGVAFKAFAAGLNVVRINMRNCGGDAKMELTPTLYNAGMSCDLRAIVNELVAENFGNIFLVGYSLGGNIVLKLAGELGDSASAYLSGVAAISPSLDLAACVGALERGENRIYERWFLRTLKNKVRIKARLFPGLYDITKLANVNSIREFDDAYTAPHGGYHSADNYYAQASAQRFLLAIAVPTLIVTSQDDPLVPFHSFEQPSMKNPQITLRVTKQGGHAGFIQRKSEPEENFDLFWAENRVVRFCQEVILSCN